MPDEKVTPITEFASGKPLRIELGQGVQWVKEANRLQSVNYARVYERPKPGSRAKPKLLLGPVGVPGEPQASYGDILRQLAKACDLADEATKADQPDEEG